MGVTRNWRLDTDCTSKIHLVKDVRSVCSDKFLTSSSSRSLFHFGSCIFAYWERMITSRVSMATVESETNDLRLLFELIGARVGSKIRHLKWQILFVLGKLKQMAPYFVNLTFCFNGFWYVAGVWVSLSKWHLWVSIFYTFIFFDTLLFCGSLWSKYNLWLMRDTNLHWIFFYARHMDFIESLKNFSV